MTSWEGVNADVVDFMREGSKQVERLVDTCRGAEPSKGPHFFSHTPRTILHYTISPFSALVALFLVGALFGCTLTPPVGSRIPSPQAEQPRYYHVVWTKGTVRKKPHLEIYTTGVHLFKNDWLDHSYAEFLLGGRWERFEWNAYSLYDDITTVPAPQYHGPDRIIFHKTGEIQDF